MDEKAGYKRTTFVPSPAVKPSIERLPEDLVSSRVQSAHYHSSNSSEDSDFSFLPPGQQQPTEGSPSGDAAFPNNQTQDQNYSSSKQQQHESQFLSAYKTPAFNHTSLDPDFSFQTMSTDDYTLYNNTEQSLPKNEVSVAPAYHSDEESDQEKKRASSGWRRKKVLIPLIVLALVAVLAAVLIPVGLLVVGKDDKSSASNANKNDNDDGGSIDQDSIPDSAKGTVLDPTTWLDTTDFNTTFTEKRVGGLPIVGLNSSWSDDTKPNSKVPALNEKFEYGKLPIRGVNLGGWLILEPFITPSFFPDDDKNAVVDEWTFVKQLNESKGMGEVKKVLEKHYSTFVTESTFKEIAEAGLDHVRIPYGYWAIKTFDGDHFLPQVCWRYLLRGIEWARKYGLRVNVDLHSVPGGQNGWNHSGRLGYPHWLNGTHGDVYGNQSLDMHKQLAEFFSQDRYKNIVTIYGLVNEPKLQTLDPKRVIDWTKQAYDVVRDKGYNGTVVFGDGFLGAERWHDVFPEKKYPNMALDLHQYVIFNTDTLKMSHSGKLNFVCNQWGDMMASSSNTDSGHGNTFVGEWSQADNDCTKYLNNVGTGSRWEGKFNPGFSVDSVTSPSCPTTDNCTCDPSNQDPRDYSKGYKEFLLQFAELQMEVFESNGAWGSMYWTWDVEDWSSAQWSYKKGRDAGILPKLAYERSYNCSSTIPDFTSLGLPESY